MTDSLNSSHTIYTQSNLVFMGILKNICTLKTMRSMEEQFNEENYIDTLSILSGDSNLTEMPHSDTLNYYLEKLSPECLRDVSEHMIKSLLRMKSFNRARLLGRLAKDYPRLPGCLQTDALYASRSIMKICNRKHWNFIPPQKEPSQKTLAESYK